MSSPKTVENDASVSDFLASVKPDVRRDDAFTLLSMMERITQCPPRMWGTSIVGFDHYDYKHKNGTPCRSLITGFAPRKAAMSVYITPGFSAYADLTARLGKFRTGASCLYITRLSNIDAEVLSELISRSVQDMRARYS